MILTNSEYERLKEDSVISLNIAMLTDVIMREPKRGFVDATKTSVVVLIGPHSGMPAGMSKSPQSRVRSQQAEKESDLAWIDSEIKRAKELIDDSTGRFFRGIMSLDKNHLEKGLVRLEWIREEYSKYYSGRHGHNWKRDIFLGNISRRMEEMDYIPARCAEFLFKVCYENNFDGVRDSIDDGDLPEIEVIKQMNAVERKARVKKK